jgi:hypothetical protein
MLLEAETNKYCPGGNDIGAITNLITWVLNFFLSEGGKMIRTFEHEPVVEGVMGRRSLMFKCLMTTSPNILLLDHFLRSLKIL